VDIDDDPGGLVCDTWFAGFLAGQYPNDCGFYDFGGRRDQEGKLVEPSRDRGFDINSNNCSCGHGSPAICHRYEFPDIFRLAALMASIFLVLMMSVFLRPGIFVFVRRGLISTEQIRRR
jgi:hypothetical protein